MTNWEKYKDELIKISTVNSFSVKDGEVVPCSECDCVNCFFNDENTSKGCGELRLEWLDEEYKESTEEYKEPSNYDNWEIDEPIEVSDDGKYWYQAHFARISEEGKPLAWIDGRTSWTGIMKQSWNYARKVGE